MKRKVLILGASGMLGSAVFRGFLQSADYDVTATIRSPESARFFSDRERSHLSANVDVLDGDSLVSLLAKLRPDIVVNCIGLIKQLSSAKDPLVALPINSLFPHKLARLCALSKTRLVHISTDCVFTGSNGLYSEDSVPDATDLYGLSKYLGEVVDYENAVTLRTSIIGREMNTANSLVDWFLGQTGTVKGFTKAIFSGVPTCELATIIRDVVAPNPQLRGLYHVSARPIAKYDLLRLIAKEYGKDIDVVADDLLIIDRSLNSDRFTAATGYVAAEWPELIQRMHSADLRGEK